jgi:hypothetical protein
MAAIFFGHAVASFSIRQLGDIRRDPPRQTAALDVTTRHRQEFQSGTRLQITD